MRFCFPLVATLLLVLVLSVSICTSCSDEERFPSDAHGSLSFSVDTLEMDTLIAGEVSPTRRLVIRNNSNDPLRIVGISFLQGKSEGFRVIVDGIRVTDTLTVPIDCRSGDSLQVFVQTLLPESGENHPVHHKAVLAFTLANGICQQLCLSAWGQDVVTLSPLVSPSGVTLQAGKPYLVRDSLVVPFGASLTLQPGVILLFRSNAYMRIEGSLIAKGTLEAPICFRGNRMDYMFPNQPYDRISGQWQGIIIGSRCTGVDMDFCDIHSGSYGLFFEGTDASETSPLMTIRNSIIHNMSGHGIEAHNSHLHIGNSQITNAGGNCISIYGGKHEFIHCTIGQFYPFSALSGPALYLANSYSGTFCPLYQADFINCIITGYSDDDIIGESIGDDDETHPFRYCFSHCLLNTPEVVDPLFISNVWESKEHKVMHENNFTGFIPPSLIYGFQLDSLSSAIGIGDTLATLRYPLDRKGKNRLSDHRSDAGCYEYSSTPTLW